MTLPNSSSVGLHESLGFKPIGIYRDVGHKLGRWHDVGWWQLPLGEREAPPGTPTPLPDAVGSPVWAEAMESGLGLLKQK